MNFAAIDFETANERRSSACSVGISIVEHGTLVHNKTWLIKPTPEFFRPINISIHGIRPEDVKNAPSFEEVWHQVEAMTRGLPFVAHNAAFDMSVVRHGLDAANTDYPNIDYLCTLLLSRFALPEKDNHKLNSLCEMYEIPLLHHDAGADAMACAKLLLILSEKLSLFSVDALSSVLEFGKLYTKGKEKGYQPARLRK